MKKTLIALLLAGATGASAYAEVAPGKPAPDFTLSDQTGKPRKLSDAKGKYVVLEWFNQGCPFVRRHYDSRNMQGLQKKYAEKGVVWYSVLSSAKGKEGYLDAKNAVQAMKTEGMASTALLLDPKGVVGRLYGAKTTPHMFVIDPKGTLIYMGGIDDSPSTDVESLKDAHNYVSEALDAAMSGKSVPHSATRPYGCSVKYGG